MPACLTHNLFAMDVLERLDEPELNTCAFAWGAQGPDFLFCHRYLRSLWDKGVKSLKGYGSALHGTLPSRTLEALRVSVRNHSGPLYRSYALGFLCHYALDSTAHPYVNARARELARTHPGETEGTMHGETEASLDAIVLRWKTGRLPGEVNLKTAFPKNEGVQRMIARLYSEVLFAVYGDTVPEGDLYQATRDAHLLFALCNDPSGLKRGVFSLVERGGPHNITSHLVPVTEDPDEDFANTGGAPWTHEGRESTEDFFGLYNRALGLAADLCRGFDSIGFEEATGDRPFG